MSDEIDEYIQYVSKFYWDMLRKKIELNRFKCDFPLVVIKEINNVQNICTHILFSKKNRILEGSFYIHNTCSPYNDHNINCIYTDENSLNVNKTYYLNHTFLFEKNYYLSNNKIMLEYSHFKNKISNLVKDIIPNIKFNTFFGKFEIESDKKNNNQIKLYQNLINIFSNNNNIKTISDKCCICYCDTATKTECNHSLCILCFNKLKKKCIESNEECKCPICRQNI